MSETYDNQERPYAEESYNDRDRSRSPRAHDRDGDTRVRDAGDDRGAAPPPREDEAPNEGTNLFCTGIHPRLNESDVQRLFEKYGDVESCSIMRDPHTRESRGFGFVNMQTGEQADAAKNGLNGEVIEGRTLSIEKARRSRPRTPTPGKYFGPPKRDDRRGGGRSFGGDRYERRGGYDRRDDYRDRGGYRDRYDDRGYSRRDYDDRGPPRGGSYRDDRYRDDRRGGGRDYADSGASRSGGGGSGGGGGSYDDDRYARR